MSELQKLAVSDKLLMHAWPAVAVAKVNDMISRGQIQPEIPMGTLIHAYRQFSPTLIDGILDAIRNRVLDVALALQRVMPRVGEAELLPSILREFKALSRTGDENQAARQHGTSTSAICRHRGGKSSQILDTLAKFSEGVRRGLGSLSSRSLGRACA